MTITEKPQLKPDPKTLKFGHNFSDHMLLVEWNLEKGWNTPSIIPFGNLSLSPASSCFHYAIEVDTFYLYCTLLNECIVFPDLIQWICNSVHICHFVYTCM